jgi:antitoxin (DNA-binding transcriptional repressor) of toxin-antitoxin stability system
MRFITVTDLRLNAPKITHEIEDTGEEVIVTRNGRPVVLMRRVGEEEFVLKGERAEGSNNVKK